MKKIFYVLLFVSSLSIKAQEYEFDTMTIYSSKFGLNQNSVSNYFSSKNKTYSFTIFSYDGILQGRLYDYKRCKVHYYNVEEVRSNNDTITKFTYQESSYLKTGQEFYTSYVYDFETTEENDDYKQVKLNVFKNSKRKKPVIHFDLKLKKIDVNLFQAFRVSCIHRFEFVPQFDINGNYIVESAKGVTHEGQIIEHRLLEYRKINLILKAD